jgi:tryptophan 2,3-dioxygenase
LPAALSDTFHALLREKRVELIDLYRGSADTPLYRLAEALIEWDDRVGTWRAIHYKIVTRIIGDVAVGTKGTPVSALARMLDQRLFPELWRVRSEMTESGPMSALQGYAA